MASHASITDYRSMLERMFEAVDARDWRTVASYYLDDCVYDRPGFPTVKGREALLEFYAVARPIQSGLHKIDLVVQEGTRACASGSFKGMLKSGDSIELRFLDTYLFEGRQIRRRETFFFTPLA
jgi:ketosteroid isomerase-like protein